MFPSKGERGNHSRRDWQKGETAGDCHNECDIRFGICSWHFSGRQENPEVDKALHKVSLAA